MSCRTTVKNFSSDVVAQRIAERVRDLRKKNRLMPVRQAVQIILNTGHYPEGMFSRVCAILGSHKVQTKKSTVDLPLWRKN